VVKAKWLVVVRSAIECKEEDRILKL